MHDELKGLGRERS